MSTAESSNARGNSSGACRARVSTSCCQRVVSDAEWDCVSGRSHKEIHESPDGCAAATHAKVPWISLQCLVKVTERFERLASCLGLLLETAACPQLGRRRAQQSCRRNGAIHRAQDNNVLDNQGPVTPRPVRPFERRQLLVHRPVCTALVVLPALVVLTNDREQPGARDHPLRSPQDEDAAIIGRHDVQPDALVRNRAAVGSIDRHRWPVNKTSVIGFDGLQHLIPTGVGWSIAWSGAQHKQGQPAGEQRGVPHGCVRHGREAVLVRAPAVPRRCLWQPTGGLRRIFIETDR
eukprot:5112548-Prymnesium_polylepis.1